MPHLAAIGLGRHCIRQQPVVSLLGLASGLVMLPAAASALTVQQTFTDTFTLAPIPATDFSFSPSIAYGPPSEFMVQPSDPSLGAIYSATFDWRTAGASDFVTGPSGGGVNLFVGGFTWINDNSWTGYTKAQSGGAGPNSSVAFVIDPPGGVSYAFFQDYKSDFERKIMSYVTGASPYALALRDFTQQDHGYAPYKIYYTGLAGGSASITTTLTVTYDYSRPPVPGPLPALGAAGLWSWSRRLKSRLRVGD